LVATKGEYDYDPYGKQTKIAESGPDADFGFAGMSTHSPSGLSLTLFRAYSPTLGRWLSRDPLGERASPNLYTYVLNNPLTFTDMLGLGEDSFSQTMLQAIRRGNAKEIRELLETERITGGIQPGSTLDKEALDIIIKLRTPANELVRGGARSCSNYNPKVAEKSFEEILKLSKSNARTTAEKALKSQAQTIKKLIQQSDRLLENYFGKRT
jgi:RHS repeat-associated protein